MTFFFLIHSFIFFNAYSVPEDLVLSYKCIKRSRIYNLPSFKSKVIGTVNKGTRLPLFKVLNKRCRKGHFIKVGVNRYTCDDRFIESLGFPGGITVPFVQPKHLMQYDYLKIINNTKGYRSKTDILQNRPYGFFSVNSWIRNRKIIKKVKNIYYSLSSKGLWLPFGDLDKRSSSNFHGIKIQGHLFYTPAIIISLKGAVIWKTPGIHKKITLPRKSWIKLTGKMKKLKKKKFFQLTSGNWIGEWNIRRFFIDKKPKILNFNKEKWIEVILREQTLIAYEGSTPVYMTLISSGRKKFRTPTGIFRIFYKRGSLTIESKKGSKWNYLFEDVPWIQFFKGTLAIHAAYWHDLFGNQYSMGCIEVSPIDARFLYNWTLPKVPKGFMSYSQNRKEAGTLLRIVKFPGQNVNYKSQKKFLPKNDK